jgi:acyl dehydratase
VTELPDDVRKLLDQPQYEITGEFPVEQGYIWTSCASVENGNPLFWDDDVADAITAGPIAPPTMVSVWFRPHHWRPGRSEPQVPLQVHFDLKARFELPEAVMSDNTLAFYEPVRLGDRLRTHQVLRSVSEEKSTKLGTGRFWVIDVVYHNQRDELVCVESYTGFGYSGSERREAGLPPSSERGPSGPAPRAGSAGRMTTRSLLLGEVREGDTLPLLTYDVTSTTVVLGALATRDWRPMHHDYHFATERNGTKDIFLNTPNQAAWFERYLTDWTGPKGRLGRLEFRMRGSVFPGDTMALHAVVTKVEQDDTGCGWAELDVMLRASGAIATTCAARVALPVSNDDNPWSRRAEAWRP